MKVGCQFDVVKGNTKEGEIFSSFRWIVGEEYATLYLNQDTFKKVKMNFGNRNRVEILDERDYEFLNENGELVYEESDQDNME